MSAAIPPMSSQVEQPKLSEVQRVVNAYVAPSKTFEDIRRNASWWLPWLITAVFLGAVLYVFDSKVDLEQLVRDQIAQSPRAQMFENLTPEQQQQQIALAIKIQKALPYVFPVLSIIFGLIIAAILMFTFNFVHEAEVSYGRSLAIFFYAGLPAVIGSVLAIISLSAGSDIEDRNPRNLVATNPAYFMDFHNTSKFLYGMAASLDVITIWTIVLVGMGFKLNSAKTKLSTGAAIGTVVVLYLIWRLAVSALGWV
jgi:hypothetical protein